ncbi:MAG: FlaA1/EpsC-like NDP-sugar epimerase, partial [Oleispira sp.]
MISYILNAKRKSKRLISVGYDLVAIPLSIYLALALRHGTAIPEIHQSVITSIIITTLTSVAIFIKLGLYRAVVRFMAEKAFGAIMIGS